LYYYIEGIGITTPSPNPSLRLQSEPQGGEPEKNKPSLLPKAAAGKGTGEE